MQRRWSALANLFNRMESTQLQETTENVIRYDAGVVKEGQKDNG